MKYNENFFNLTQNYVFNELKLKVKAKKLKGDTSIIDLGIGDVKLPLFDCFIREMKQAVDDMGKESSFHGYAPAEGYDFLREAISNYYSDMKIDLGADEIFITDGAKGPLGSICELFGRELNTLFLSPCYPAGAEANVLYGNKVTYLCGLPEDGFFPNPPFGKKYDLIYICSPSNPTGSVMTYRQLSTWIDYALSVGGIIIFDGAYSAFISGDFPKSVYHYSKAKRCAIEINSFSKSLGFTGIRCGYTVIPKEVGDYNKIYKRWLGCRFNGVNYIAQRGASAFFTAEGRECVKKRINFYKTNSEIVKIALKNKNLWYNSTVSSPYIFAKTPHGYTSTEFCSLLLEKIGVVGTPGVGFGEGGEGYFRLSAFSSRREIIEASDRINGLSI